MLAGHNHYFYDMRIGPVRAILCCAEAAAQLRNRYLIFGNALCETRRWIDERDKPVRSFTVRSLRIMVGISIHLLEKNRIFGRWLIYPARFTIQFRRACGFGLTLPVGDTSEHPMSNSAGSDTDITRSRLPVGRNWSFFFRLFVRSPIERANRDGFRCSRMNDEV